MKPTKLIFLSFICGSVLIPISANARAKQSKATIDLGAEVFLVKGKTIAGVDLNAAFTDRFGLHLGFGLVTADEDAPRHNIQGDWLGSLLSFHFFLRNPIARNLEARFGTGVDAWLLAGIASGESKFAWPVYAEGRLQVAPSAALFLRGRYYVVSSDGLEVGEAYDGSTQHPFLVSAGVAYVF
jgi:hypothetical protein